MIARVLDALALVVVIASLAIGAFTLADGAARRPLGTLAVIALAGLLTWAWRRVLA